MQSFAFFVALFAAGASAKSMSSDPDNFKLSFSSIKDETTKFSSQCRNVLNGEGPTFTVDVSDHTLSGGVGEESMSVIPVLLLYLSCSVVGVLGLIRLSQYLISLFFLSYNPGGKVGVSRECSYINLEAKRASTLQDVDLGVRCVSQAHPLLLY